MRIRIRPVSVEATRGITDWSEDSCRKDVGSRCAAQKEIDWIGNWMNGLPRKGYGYRTPEELFEEQLDIIYSSPA